MPSKFKEWKKNIIYHKKQILLALLFLAVSMISMVYSSNYVDSLNTISVPDLILDSIPSVDLSFLFIWGFVFVVAVYIFYPLFYKPKKFHYALGMLSLFILVRSAFIILTHLKAPSAAITVTAPSFLSSISYANDLFFSGHTGLPFLGFLVYNDGKIIKYFMLFSSVILAITVLLMHVHYSIDVASAYFITYGVYTLGTPMFGNSIKEPQII